MQVAIISDVHDNLENLKISLAWINKNKISNLICCGDLTNSETLQFLADNFLGDIYLVKGNGILFKEEEVKKFKNIKYFGQVGRFKLGDKFVGLCHEPFLRDRVLDLGACDIIFYGHTHKPWEEVFKGVRSVNPGTLGALFSKGSFALWDMESDEIELKVLGINT